MKTKRLTAGTRKAPLWVVVNALDKHALSGEGGPDPWRSRMLGRVELALKSAGWTGAVHLRPLSAKIPQSHHESRGLAPMPHDRAQLRHMVELHEPRVIVLVGDAALESVTGHKKAGKYAGSVLWVPDLGTWALAIEDPFTWVMDHTKFHAAIRDLGKAVRIAQGVEPEPRRAEVEVLREYDEALEFLGRLEGMAFMGTPISCDIEAWNGIVRSIAWSYEDHTAVVLPLATIKGNALWSEEEAKTILARLRAIFALPAATWIFQNAIFDDTVLHDCLGIEILGTVHDTMARHNVLYPDQPKNLGFQVRWYLLWDQYHKDDAKAWRPNSNAKDEDLWAYNGVDADTTRRVFFAQEAEPGIALGGDYASAFREHLSGLPELYSAVRSISLGGLRVDPSVLASAREENQKAIGEFAAELAKLLGRPVWVTSPEKEAMREELEEILEFFGLRAAFSRADGSLGPMTPKRKALVAALVPALLPGQAGPILAGMLGAGVEPLEAVNALATGKLPEGAFCFARKEQIKTLLYEELGLPVQTKRRVKVTGETSESTTGDTTALKRILADLERQPDGDTHAGRVITCLLALASLTQMEKAYFSALPSRDGRFRGSYNIAGTSTRRFACNKWFDGTGFNLMTFPRGDFAYSIPGLSGEQRSRLERIAKALKRSILPDAPGHLIVNMDLAQAEARDVAYQSRDPRMIHGFESGVDFHSYNAMNIWGYESIEAVPKHRRQQAKIAGHGSNYLMGTGTISRDMQVPYAQGKKAQEGYYSAYARIPEWHKALRARLLKGLPIVNAFGWPRISHGDPTDMATLRAMAAHGPQSTIPMVVNRAWLEYRRRGEPFGRILMQTHDSLTASVPVEHVDAYCALLRELTEQPIPVTDIMGPFKDGEAREYVIPCDFEVGPNYGDLERYLTAEEEAAVWEALAQSPEDISDAEIAALVGVSKDAVEAARKDKGREWWHSAAQDAVIAAELAAESEEEEVSVYI